jgi:hypothetical protein
LSWVSGGVADGWVGNALSKVGATTDDVGAGAGTEREARRELLAELVHAVRERPRRRVVLDREILERAADDVVVHHERERLPPLRVAPELLLEPFADEHLARRPVGLRGVAIEPVGGLGVAIEVLVVVRFVAEVVGDRAPRHAPDPARDAPHEGGRRVGVERAGVRRPPHGTIVR